MSRADRYIDTMDDYGIKQRLVVTSFDSPRDVNGKLLLRANPHSLVRATRVGQYVSDPYYRGFVKDAPGFNWTYGNYNKALQKALVSFRRKVHKGDASLGVTLGSWSQSRDMITKRLHNANSFMKRVRTPRDAVDLVREMHRTPEGGAVGFKKGIANDHLEWVFGWVPLFQDIHAAMAVLGAPMPPLFISGRGSSYQEGIAKLYEDKITFALRRTVTCSGRVFVSNPNSFLLNRLGLLNPAVVAWDLIPWSFVVGMFVNITQLLNSMTDWVGITLTDYSETSSLEGYQTASMYDNYAHTGPIRVTSYGRIKQKDRIVKASPSKPPLIWRPPELSIGLLGITAALAVQQSTRIASLLPKAFFAIDGRRGGF